MVDDDEGGVDAAVDNAEVDNTDVDEDVEAVRIWSTLIDAAFFDFASFDDEVMDDDDEVVNSFIDAQMRSMFDGCFFLAGMVVKPIGG